MTAHTMSNHLSCHAIAYGQRNHVEKKKKILRRCHCKLPVYYEIISFSSVHAIPVIFEAIRVK